MALITKAGFEDVPGDDTISITGASRSADGLDIIQHVYSAQGAVDKAVAAAKAYTDGKQVPTPTLEQVTTAGNTTDKTINISGTNAYLNVQGSSVRPDGVIVTGNSNTVGTELKNDGLYNRGVGSVYFKTLPTPTAYPVVGGVLMSPTTSTAEWVDPTTQPWAVPAGYDVGKILGTAGDGTPAWIDMPSVGDAYTLGTAPYVNGELVGARIDLESTSSAPSTSTFILQGHGIVVQVSTPSVLGVGAATISVDENALTIPTLGKVLEASGDTATGYKRSVIPDGNAIETDYLQMGTMIPVGGNPIWGDGIFVYNVDKLNPMFASFVRTNGQGYSCLGDIEFTTTGSSQHSWTFGNEFIAQLKTALGI